MWAAPKSFGDAESSLFGHDNQMIALRRWSSPLRYRLGLWNIPDARLVATLRSSDYIGPPMEFSRDGRSIAAVGQKDNGDEYVRIYDTKALDLKAHIGDVDAIRSLAFSKSGDRLIGAGYRGQILEWDVKSGRLVRETHTTGLGEPKTPWLLRAALASIWMGLWLRLPAAAPAARRNASALSRRDKWLVVGAMAAVLWSGLTLLACQWEWLSIQQWRALFVGAEAIPVTTALLLVIADMRLRFGYVALAYSLVSLTGVTFLYVWRVINLT
jgi:hypothetical protein